MFNFITRVFGSANERMIRKYRRIVHEINKKEEEYIKFTDEQLKHCTTVFKERVANGISLDEVLVDAFAVVRESSKRVFGMRPFDVQLVGGIVLHNGIIAEMKTGEGKTLTATLPIYLNALTQKGIHVVTVNDYLAKRDAKEMGQLYNFLGLSTGCIVHGLMDYERREQYACDITYGTNHEYGFDYLRDNMKFRAHEMVMRPFHFAIVDEVDSILIDEARTPLIISGPAEDSSTLYKFIDQVICTLTEEDYEKDIKQKGVTLTDPGIEKIEKLLKETEVLQGDSLYDIHNITLVHHVNAALKAHVIFAKDVDYIVKDGKVVIIDEFTGRMMDGRRYSEGLHQALEAKEHVDVENENQTLASITYQNFFRMYPKLAGMTGTALTEEAEFQEIYNLRVVSIPTNVNIVRKDYDDEVYLTSKERFDAVITLIKECYERKQPILVGTGSIERSEHLHELLEQEGIPHQVLNARYHEQEAYIIAEAGSSGAITIATNMAGRGTDIKLGGNMEMRLSRALSNLDTGEREANKEALTVAIQREIEEGRDFVLKAGGLYVIGTERHESRRIDNQLRGRSGRQGDPGASRFFVSLEDDLMKRFGSDRLDQMLRRLGAKEGEVISHPWINKALERAQRKVEAHNFEIRKHLLKYDDVMNDQRRIVYQHRLELLQVDGIEELIIPIKEEVIEQVVYQYMPLESLPEQWNPEGLHATCSRLFALELPIYEWLNEEGVSQQDIINRLTDALDKHLIDKEEQYTPEVIRSAEKNILLRVLDQHWKDHLLMLDHLRQGINLRSYAQNNPLNEYKREAFNLFQDMLYKVKEDVLSILTHFELAQKNSTLDDIHDILDPHIDFDELEENTPIWEDDPLYQDEETFNELYKEGFENKKENERNVEDTLPHVALSDILDALNRQEREKKERPEEVLESTQPKELNVPRKPRSFQLFNEKQDEKPAALEPIQKKRRVFEINYTGK